MRLHLYFFLFTCCFQLNTLRSQDFWQPLGGPDGINIRYFYFDGQGICYAFDFENEFFRSEDQGKHWTLLTPPVPSQFFPFSNFSPGFDGRLFCTSVTGGLLSSTDHGDSWQLVNTPFGDIIKATSLPGGAIIATTGTSLFRTFDGVSWQQVIDLGSDAFKEIYDIGWFSGGMTVVAINDFQNPSADRFLLSFSNGITWDTLPGMASLSNTAPAGANTLVWKNADAGLFLSSAGQTQAVSIPHPISLDQQYNFVCLPTGRLFISTSEKTFFTDNFGQQWQTYNGNLWGVLHNAPVPGQVLVKRRSSFQGTYRSTDLGQKWTYSGYGPDKAWVYDWTFKSTDTIFSVSAAGLWRSFDGGNDWTIAPLDSCVNSLDSLGTYNLIFTPEHELLLLRPGKLLRSEDYGATFTDITPPANTGNFIRISVQPGTGYYFMVCSDRLIQSKDKGASWETVNDQTSFSPQKIQFHPSGSLYAYSYQPTPSLIRSADQGITWQSTSLNVSVGSSNPLVIDQSGRIIVAGFKKIWISEDDGQNWIARTAPFDIQSLVVDQDGNLIIGCLTENRLFISKNGGILWQKLPDIPGLPADDGIISLAISPDQQLYVSTDNHGQFRSAQTTPAPVLPTLELTCRIFPNPSNGRFRIDQLPTTGSTITISDLTGRQILQQTTCDNAAEISLPEYITGIVLVEIDAPGYVMAVRKIVIGL